MPDFQRQVINVLARNPNIIFDFIGINGAIYFTAVVHESGGTKTYKLSAKADSRKKLMTIKSANAEKYVPTSYLGIMDLTDFSIIFG